MPHEMLIGLLVNDDSTYARYREAMLPILEAHGGGFGYDFRVSEVLRSRADHDINRVFTIFFPDRAARDRFFDHPEYQQARSTFFEPSVGGLTVLAEYDGS